ncbi:MAG: aspartate--tRNA(Asn) ligase [Actinomycetales bacterium]|nr:aspartate--tRNA(Asn) ligase [Actinomycetales bacterium]
MRERTLVKELAAREDGPVLLGGWVEKLRDQKRIQFIILRDESGDVQVTYPRPVVDEQPVEDDALAATVSTLTAGSFVWVKGRLKHDERVKLGGLEVQLDDLEIVSLADPETPIADDTSIDKRMDWRFLDLRRSEMNLVFRIQTTIEQAWRQYWAENNFVEIHSPKLMASASESNAELFKLEYFETHAYLAQSPQFYKQMAMMSGLGRIFEIGPVFRADPSFTSRHATEFVSVDIEVSWIDSHEDIMAIQEQLMHRAISAVKEKHGDEILARFGVEVQVPSIPFPRVALHDAIEIIKERGHTVERGGDLDPEGERQIAAWAAETHGHEFVFVTDYPATVRPFYHMRHADNPALTNSYDLIWRGTEITTGAQREHRLDVLIEQVKQKGLEPEGLQTYLDFFKYGAPAHGGFGMGLLRVIMLLLHQPNIREVGFLFRGPNRLEP